MSKSQEFLEAMGISLSNETFVKIALANYSGEDPDLKKIHAKRILIKREEKLSFTYQYKTKDIVKNYHYPEALGRLEDYLQDGFNTALLCTTQFDLQFEKNGSKINLKKIPAKITQVPSLDHDKQKTRSIGSGRTYLQDLKITDANGQVFRNAQDKYRQINRYIELLDPLLKTLPTDKKLKIADMGSGKGYLTFALYDYMTNTLKLDVEIAGVEYRADMVDLCNKIAANAGFMQLHFVQSGIKEFKQDQIDILIALHACDTATDDAIYKGIRANAELIVVAPCCHKQVRKEMEKGAASNDLEFLTKHGIFMERQAEMVTDGLRAEMLQYSGYATKVFEFISAEHTAKNVMITAIKNPKTKNGDTKILDNIKSIKKYFGIGHHHLEQLLNLRDR